MISMLKSAITGFFTHIFTGVLVGLLIITMLSSCNNQDHLPDVSNIHVTLNTARLDRDLAAIDTNHVGAGLQSLKAKYPDFLNFYLDTLMGFGIYDNFTDTNKAIREGLRVFLTYKDYRGLFDTIDKHFPDTKEIDNQLTKGFQYLRYYDSSFNVPRIIYFSTGLDRRSAFNYEGRIICIGLDMYLGEQYPYYASVGIPDYQKKSLQPLYISPNVFKVIHQINHPFEMEGKTLLDMMIQKGKEQYFLSKVIPFCHDTARLGFTKKQLDWCVANESMIYNFFVKEKFLYETNWQLILRYVNDGPTATGMPAESPGNIGTWLGWQIVKAYMNQHPSVTLQELLKEKDAQAFLTESKYKPL